MTLISRGRWRFHSVKSTSGLTSDVIMAMGFRETKCALPCSAEGVGHQLVDRTCFICMRIST